MMSIQVFTCVYCVCFSDDNKIHGMSGDNFGEIARYTFEEINKDREIGNQKKTEPIRG